MPNSLHRSPTLGSRSVKRLAPAKLGRRRQNFGPAAAGGSKASSRVRAGGTQARRRPADDGPVPASDDGAQCCAVGRAGRFPFLDQVAQGLLSGYREHDVAHDASGPRQRGIGQLEQNVFTRMAARRPRTRFRRSPCMEGADKEDAGAMYDLGFMYENGNGVSKDRQPRLSAGASQASGSTA